VGECGDNVPRYSDVKSREQRERYIGERVQRRIATDTIPQWESGDSKPVECAVIQIPLSYLVYRLQNLRTIDAQEFSTSPNGPYPGSDIFTPENEDAQETQDAQHALLIEQARKTENRNGNQNLFELLTEHGWSSRDRPIITPSGVLINGNCRVATIEEIAQNRGRGEEFEGKTIDRIDLTDPMIEVKVTPTNPDSESTIIKLERLLQRTDPGRLDYDWIQDTTDIRRMVDRGMSEAEVHNEFKIYADFQTMKKFRNMRNMRDLLDGLLLELGRPGESYRLSGGRAMIEEANRLLANESFSSPNDNRNLRAIILLAIKALLEGVREGYWHRILQSIKSPADVRRIHLNMQEDTGQDPIVELDERQDEFTGVVTQEVRVDIDRIVSSDEGEIRRRVQSISDTTEELRRDQRDGDMGERAEKKVNAAIIEVVRALDAIDQASANGIEVDFDSLSTKITELEEKIRTLNDRID